MEKEIIVISKLCIVLVLKEVEMWPLFLGRLLYLFRENEIDSLTKGKCKSKCPLGENWEETSNLIVSTLMV